MTTTFNRDQIVRLTRETLDHTLRFFNTVNENLHNLVKNVHHNEMHPVTVEDITKICNDFHRDHDVRMHELNSIWTDFTKTVRNTIPTTIPNLFDPNEVIRLNRDMIDHTMRFFNTTNEALIKGQVPSHDHILPRNVIETINKAVEDFRKTQLDLTRAFDTTFHKVFETITATVKTTTHTTHTDHKAHDKTTADTRHPIHGVRDEVFTLNRDIIEHTIRFFMNINEHVVAIIENVDPKNVEKHADLLNRVRDEHVDNHRRMIERFDLFIRRTAETLSTAHLGKHEIPTDVRLFDHTEVLRINQDAIATSVKFFTTITENLLKEVRKDHIDTLIHATTEFHKHHEILTNRVETIWRDALNTFIVTRDRNETKVHATETKIHHHDTVNEKVAEAHHDDVRTTKTVDTHTRKTDVKTDVKATKRTTTRKHDTKR